MIVSLDFETSGLDLFHGARPFAAVWCTEEGPRCREWAVDPLTRVVTPDPAHVAEIRTLLAAAERVVCHNSKFDMRCLESLGIEPPWDKVDDTLIAAHVLHSAPPHNLTAVTKDYLGEDIALHEAGLEKAVKKCRNMVQQARLKEGRLRGKGVEPEPDPIRAWRVTEEGVPDQPSAKGQDGLWRSDYWLPAAMFRHDPESPPEWETVLRDYALVDAVATYRLWPRLKALLVERGLWKVYRAKMEVVPAAYRMERRGMSVHTKVIDEYTTHYAEETEYAADVLTGVAKGMGYDLVLPKGNTSHNFDDFLFGLAPRPDGKRDVKLPRTHAPDTLNLPVLAVTESGAPCFDYDARELTLGHLTPGTKPYLFVETYHRRADYEKALSALRDYERFMVCGEGGGACRVHPSFNVTGTQTTRWSSNNPNAQNISKQSSANLRRCFGPAPGWVWYSMDAANIELRIPAYLADERELIDVFERPNDAPYYGSYHLVVFDTLHPEVFAKHGKRVKDDDFELSHLYRCVKNGNFARQYGAQEAKVDATYRVKGGYRKVANRFPRIDKLNRDTIARANATGRVIALPDRSVDPDHGYPIVCRRNQYDRISPTIPFAYFVSGSAGVWMNRAVVKCDRLLETWRRDEGYDGHMVACVHDEIVFEIKNEGVEKEQKWIKLLKQAMEDCGTAIGIPTPVSVERHAESWAVGESVRV